jgi:hypothetical protein
MKHGYLKMRSLGSVRSLKQLWLQEWQTLCFYVQELRASFQPLIAVNDSESSLRTCNPAESAVTHLQQRQSSTQSPFSFTVITIKESLF